MLRIFAREELLPGLEVAGVLDFLWEEAPDARSAFDEDTAFQGKSLSGLGSDVVNQAVMFIGVVRAAVLSLGVEKKDNAVFCCATTTDLSEFRDQKSPIYRNSPIE